MSSHDYQRRQWITDVCSTGKRAYFNRRTAKAAARQCAKNGSSGNRPYRCPHCDYWHIGHKPLVVMTGEASADEVYGGGDPGE